MPVDHNPVGWFEIPATDMPRAKAFYECVFGFEMELHQMGPLEMAWFPMREGAISIESNSTQGSNKRSKNTMQLSACVPRC